MPGSFHHKRFTGMTVMLSSLQGCYCRVRAKKGIEPIGNLNDSVDKRLCNTYT